MITVIIGLKFHNDKCTILSKKYPFNYIHIIFLRVLFDYKILDEVVIFSLFFILSFIKINH
jgi:hypothetical protein